MRSSELEAKNMDVIEKTANKNKNVRATGLEDARSLVETATLAGAVIGSG